MVCLVEPFVAASAPPACSSRGDSLQVASELDNASDSGGTSGLTPEYGRGMTGVVRSSTSSIGYYGRTPCERDRSAHHTRYTAGVPFHTSTSGGTGGQKQRAHSPV